MNEESATERHELAKEILLKIIEITPQLCGGRVTLSDELAGEGVKLAWIIADAFLRAEPKQ